MSNSNHCIHNHVSCYRAKNHISPEEPYFATFNHNNFHHPGGNFGHLFESADTNAFKFHWHERKKGVSVKNKEIT